MSKSNKNKKNNKNILNYFVNELKQLSKIEIIILIIFFILTSFINFHHELSQDEIQSFIIAKDLNYLEIIKHTIYEGHSFFWTFLISPFAKLNLPIESQKLIPLFISFITAFIILKKSPFKFYLKLLLIFNSGLVYYYSSFARPYCLIVFFLVLIAAIYAKRKEHPYLYVTLIGLLANTHAIMLPTVGFLLAYFYYDIKKDKIKLSKKETTFSLLITIILVTIPLVIYILGYFYCEINAEPTILQCLKVLKETYPSIYANMVMTFFGVNQNNFIPCMIFCSIFVIINGLCLFALKKNLKFGILFWTQFQFVVLIHATIWFPIATRNHLLIYFLMFWLWMTHYQKKIPNKSLFYLKLSLTLLITLSIPNNYKIAYTDILYKYSDAKETAQFIKRNIPKNSVFINISSDYSQLIAGYLDKKDYKIYMPNQERFITFQIWDSKYPNKLSFHSILESINYLKKDYENIYLLVPSNDRVECFPIEILNYQLKLKKLYETNKKSLMSSKDVLDLTSFEIYKIE